MTFREMNLRVFQGKPAPHVFFQPRMEPWLHWHRTFGKLPPRYHDVDVRTFYDDLDCSMRYIHYYTDVPDPVVRRFTSRVTVREHTSESEKRIVYETLHGDLVEEKQLTVDDTWRTVGFPVKTLDDLRCLRWLCGEMTYHFVEANFQQGSDFIGQRGEPQFWVPKSPYQALAQIWMKLEDLIYALADDPELVEEVMRAIDASYDSLYEELVASGRVKIINFGENIHDQLISPRYWERYFILFYEKRCAQLKEGGIYSHVHIDGYFRSLLPYLADLPFDGLEALTPRPQGDVTLEEMAAAMGDKVLLDGIPAVMFMPQYSREELMAMTEKIVELFHPRLILGISDEVPEGTGPEAIERVRTIATWCREQTM
jgi:hypothetical protein